MRRDLVDPEHTPQSTDEPELLRFNTSGAFPDVFADSVHIATGPFGIALTFALTDPLGTERHVIARLRLSPQMGFVLVQLLRKVLRATRDEGTGIQVPDAVLRQLQIQEEL
ncbi:MAG: hypothetical protein AABM40_05755 [Chloroflexota bacterium]